MKNYQKCDRVAVVALSLSVLLGLFAFVPGGFLSGPVFKGYLAIIGTLVALCAWLVGRLLEGTFSLPKTILLSATGVLIFGFFLSAIFSVTPALSFVGEGFDSGTFIMVMTAGLMLFLGSVLFTTKRRFFLLVAGFLSVYILIALYQLTHLFFPTATALGIFFDRVATPFGVWSDMAFISGAALLAFTLIFEFFKPKGNLRVLSFVGGVLSLFFVALSNVFLVWVLVGAGALVILTYRLVATRFSENRRFPFFAFALSLIALLFILANNLFGGFLAYKFKSSFVSVSPSLTATMQVAKHSLAENPVFGAGPNRFLQEWYSYHPAAVNAHMLWNVPFNSGSSYLLTTAILAGGIGILVMLLFIAAFGYESVRRTFMRTTEGTGELFVFSMFLMMVYFMLSLALFSPGVSVVIWAFFLTGLFLAALRMTGRMGERKISFLGDQRTSFFSILLIVFLMMVSAGTAYSVTERFASVVYFNKGINAAAAGDLVKADGRFLQAISLSDLPVYERARVRLAAQAVQKTVNEATEKTSQDALKSVLQQAISAGNEAARRSIDIDSKDPSNYLVLGDLMRLVAGLKVQGSFDAAKDAYERAIGVAPHYPVPYLSMAELYFESKDNDNARTYIEKALTEKPNYTDAYFLNAQIEIAENNTAGAIKKLEDATVVDPNNPDIYFELGVLRYQGSDYKGASSAFNVAVSLQPNYLNAWYFLALASDKLGNREDTITILSQLHDRLPDNETISTALENVKAGRPAQTSAAPVAETPTKTTTTKSTEKAKKLPLPSTEQN